MEEAMEVQKVVVVGMNRPRLNKILSLIEENRANESEDLTESSRLEVELIPALAALGSYEGEDGTPIRYLSNFVSLDGSPLTQFLDDEVFREQFHSVLLVGYEWKTGDEDQIANFFKSNNLSPTIAMVQPNDMYDNLHEEMEGFKKLNDSEKQQRLKDASMGPSKMERFVTDWIRDLQRQKLEALKQKQAEEQAKRLAAENAPPSTDTTQQEPKRIEPADPTRPRYACQKCRTILLGENHMAPDHIPNLHSFRRANTGKPVCQSLFCSDEVLAWLSPSGEEIEGKLTCPRCHHKIGHWRWAGAQCSCGTWITPAIQIPLSKVDIVPPAQANGVGLAGVIRPAVINPATHR